MIRLRPWTHLALWNFERGSWPYDLLWLLIVLFVLGAPAGWLGDPMVRP